MKRIIISLLVFSAYTICGHAQLADNYSLTAAVNHSAVYSTDQITVREPLTGWELGVVGEKEIISNIKISAGAKLSRIRFGLEDVGASHVTYLSLPINIKTVFPLDIYARIGPRLDLKMDDRNARKEIILNGEKGYMSDGFAEASDFFVPGWSIGIGREFNFNGLKPWIEVRYTEDFSNFSGYDGLINMKKKTGKISIGIPISGR